MTSLRQSVTLALLLCAGGISTRLPAAELQPAGTGLPSPATGPLPAHAYGFAGSASCAATACHGGERHVLVPDQISGGEYELWRSRDPHASAHLILQGEKFRDILLRLKTVSPAAEGKGHVIHDPARVQECMNCHNPTGIENPWSSTPTVFTTAGHPPAFAIECESCHGPAAGWINQHFRTDWDRRLAVSTGFHDLKNLLNRGQFCAGCHVGDAERDMNHDMIAAGHPPLRFELASYQARLPKHWNDRKEKTLVPDRELKLWLAGQAANLDRSLALLESRVARSDDVHEGGNNSGSRPAAPWPEFAEYGCTDCHQALTSSAEWSTRRKQREVSASTLRWRNWNHGFPITILGQETLGEPATRAKLQSSWQDLVAMMESGKPDGIASLGSRISTWRRDYASLLTTTPVELHGPPNERHPSIYTLMNTPQQPLPLLAWQRNKVPDLNREQTLQAYALLIATVQSRLDDPSAGGGTQLPPLVTKAFGRMKEQLLPQAGNPHGLEIDISNDEFARHFTTAIEYLEGAPSR